MNFLHIANSDKPVAFYSLDVILAVGFRVRSPRGTQFRQWANNTLKEYLQKGFILDKDRLKILTAVQIILTNCWNKSVTSVPAKSAFIKSYATCLRYPAITKLWKSYAFIFC